MREATFSTLDSIITDRANMSDIKGSLRFFGNRIQRTFPSSRCTQNNGDHELFVYKNIEYTSGLALMMADCFTFLEQPDLHRIVKRHNILMQFQRENAVKSMDSMLLFLDDKSLNGQSKDNRNGLSEHGRNRLTEHNRNGKSLRNGHLGSLRMLNVNGEFKRLNEAMGVTIGDMNRNCSVLQELFTLKRKLGKQLIRLVKYHWK